MNLSEFLKNQGLNNKKEIVFFGGSFNPWHQGHSSCLELMGSDKAVIIIPDHNPFKELTEHEEKLTSEEQLKEMAKKYNAYLFLGFAKLNKPNPSYLWIKEVKDNNPTIKLSLLLGFDTFMSIDKWYQADKLLNQIDTLYIASRLDNKDLKKKQIKHLKTIATSLELSFLGNHEYEELSSSQIRKNVK